MKTWQTSPRKRKRDAQPYSKVCQTPPQKPDAQPCSKAWKTSPRMPDSRPYSKGSQTSPRKPDARPYSKVWETPRKLDAQSYSKVWKTPPQKLGAQPFVKGWQTWPRKPRARPYLGVCKPGHGCRAYDRIGGFDAQQRPAWLSGGGVRSGHVLMLVTVPFLSRFGSEGVHLFRFKAQ